MVKLEKWYFLLQRIEYIATFVRTNVFLWSVF